MSDLEALIQALELSPDNVPLIVLLARGYIERNQHEEARRQYDRALEIDPSHTGARMGIAHLVALQGKCSEATVRLESICCDQPNYAPAWVLLATIALQEGNAQEARSYYDQAIAIDVSSADPELLSHIEQEGGITSHSEINPIPTSIGNGFATASLDPEETTINDLGIFEVGLEFSEKADIDFSSVGGMDDVKEEIRMKILYPLKNKELFETYGKKAGGGVLLYGPPGCGKTLISKATAGEINANYLSVGLHQILDMWMGRSEEKLHEIFEFARKNAPAVLFFDEVDALAASRRDMRTSAGRTLINQFLAELDGANGSNDGVLVLGATNAPWHMDVAFLRPGRFDRIIFVSPPDQPAREAIINILAHNKPIADLDPLSLAKRTPNFSGADLRAIFDQATEAALSEAMKKGNIVPLTLKQLFHAAKRMNPSTGKWFESARNYALYSNQSGFYDDVLEHLGIKK